MSLQFPSVKRYFGLLAFSILLCCCSVLNGRENKPNSTNAEMREATIDFLESLNEQQREQLSLDFGGEARTDWHFIPKERIGLSFKEMNLKQRRAARVLMRTALSDKGYLKATTIMSLEFVLRQLEADRENVNTIRDQEKYWFAVFGDPAKDEPWGWRVEGHHLSLNFTSAEGKVVGVAPIFFGANPAEVRVGPRLGLRVLGHEEDQARDLMASFTPEQVAKAIISADAPNDVLTVPGEPIDIGAPAGISGAEMNAEQRKQLSQIVSHFLHHLRDGLAEEQVREVEKSGIEKIYFAWAGSMNPDENHYFRLHGPTFVLEYDNAQGNHAHLVWHSRHNDFGVDVLRRHYHESPHHHVDE